MATTPSNMIDIPALIDANKISRSQMWILIMVGLTVVMDGFDVQAMGYVAPAIIQEWGVSNANLGPVFGAGLFGMLVGSLTLSVLSDKIGRRPVLIWSTVFFAVCMLATAHVTTITQLEILRFITGLGLGAIMPNAMAQAAEFSPKRKRVTLMMFVSCGFTVGEVLGGLLSAVMIPAFGWQSVFHLRWRDPVGDGGADVLLCARVDAVPSDQGVSADPKLTPGCSRPKKSE